MRKIFPRLVLAAVLAGPSLAWAAEAHVADGHAALAVGGSGDGVAQTPPAAQAPPGVDPATRGYASDNWAWKDAQGRICRWSEQSVAGGSGGEARHWLQVCK